MRITIYLLVACASLPGCAGSRLAADVHPEWVPIPGATFIMGDTFFESNPDALPLHEVRLAPFFMARFETTVSQYAAFALATGRPVPDMPASAPSDLAVSSVDWDDASDFCRWVGGRLPSEQEWEWAASGGPDKQLFAGTNDVDSLDAFARFRANSVARAAPVGRRRPNRFGLYDMSGNVAEWIGAFYQFYPEEGTQPSFDDPSVVGIRIIRGGSFTLDPEVARTYWRAGTLREVTSAAVGFRCARNR